MFLYILQHGDAVSGEVDPERPLSEQGRRDVRAQAMRLKSREVCPGKIIHSGKLRAEQSASLMAEVLSPDLSPVRADGLGPNDDPAMIIGDIDQMSDAVLIASHMPFVSRLCSTLLTGATDAEFASIPGTLFCLEKAESKWRLAFMLRPD